MIDKRAARPVSPVSPAGPGRVAAGDIITSRELTTIRSERIPVPYPGMLTHLQFRRFAGCPLCNLHLRSLARRHGELLAAGVREVAVFHSTAGDMLPFQGELPFAVIADPTRKLYREFGVTTSPRALLHVKAWAAPLNPRVYPMVLRGLRAGGSPGPRHGDSPLGLPADFLIGPGGQVLAAKYGRHANDQWSVDELLQAARSAGGLEAGRNVQERR
jgi:peroxiredoxin